MYWLHLWEVWLLNVAILASNTYACIHFALQMQESLHPWLFKSKKDACGLRSQGLSCLTPVTRPYNYVSRSHVCMFYKHSQSFFLHKTLAREPCIMRICRLFIMSHPADIQNQMPTYLLTSCSMVITAPVVGKLSRQSLEQIIGTLVGGVLGYLTWYLAFISLHMTAVLICW